MNININIYHLAQCSAFSNWSIKKAFSLTLMINTLFLLPFVLAQRVSTICLLPTLREQSNCGDDCHRLNTARGERKEGLHFWIQLNSAVSPKLSIDN